MISALRLVRHAVAFTALGAALAATTQGCGQTGIGDKCVPEQEFNTGFLGFDVKEVSVESKSFQCQTRLCLVNHFQGRVSCPYGQDPEGKAPTGAARPAGGPGNCFVPGTYSPQTKTGAAITGADDKGVVLDPKRKASVQPQCADRRADRAVYCSCRCADVNGQTSDGSNYCKCPDGFSCKQLVSSIGSGNEGLTGAYCIKDKSEYDANNACGNLCDADPKSPNYCGNVDGT